MLNLNKRNVIVIVGLLYYGNLFLCNPADKPTNQPTGMSENIASYVEAIQRHQSFLHWHTHTQKNPFHPSHCRGETKQLFFLID